MCSYSLDNISVILAYDMKGKLESFTKIQVDSNDGICFIRPAGVTHGHAACIAVERRRYIHLAVIDTQGKIAVRSRIDAISNQYPIFSVSPYGCAGQFIVGGYQCVKKISVMM